MPKLSTTAVIRLYAKQKGKCPYCGDDLGALVASGVTVEPDHIIPKKDGGASRVENYCLACSPCNRRKSEMSAERFLQRTKPYRDGLIVKQDILPYSKYLKLHKQFGHIVNGDAEFQPSNPVSIAEYIEILGRFEELESSIQEIFDRLERNGITKHSFVEDVVDA
jgi:hypothetical protein